MYMTKNVYQRNVTYYDGDDITIFHYLIEKAKSVFIENSNYFESLSDDEIKKLKKNNTPVIFASTVSSMKPAFDFSLIRSDMNDRARRRYLIIDADFDAGKEESSQYLYNKIIEVAKEHNTPLIIYPTVSYPEKPRFRAVMFTKNLLGAAEYYQAMSWWYDQLGIFMINKNARADQDVYEVLEGLEKDLVDAADTSNTNIRSNNNAPFFVNFDQLEAIYDNTQEEGLELLEKSLWKEYDKPKLPKRQNFDDHNMLDEYKLSDEFLDKAVHDFAKTDFAKDYNTFWRFLHSVARAEDKKQITPEQVDKILNWVAETGDNNDKELVWKLNNRSQYAIERNRVLSIPSYYKSAAPLCAYPAFRDVLLDDLGYDELATSALANMFSYDLKLDEFDKAETKKPKVRVKLKSKKDKSESVEKTEDKPKAVEKTETVKPKAKLKAKPMAKPKAKPVVNDETEKTEVGAKPKSVVKPKAKPKAKAKAKAKAKVKARPKIKVSINKPKK